MNQLTVSVSRKGNYIPEERLKHAHGFRIRTEYPHGLFTLATFSVPLRAGERLFIRGGDEFVVKNGNIVVFEGTISGINYNPYQASGSVEIEGIGDWAFFVERQSIHKRWLDNRITDAQWTFTTGTTGDGDQQCTIDREDRLRFTPKGVAWADGDYAALRYTQPYGQTTKRLTYSYDLQEGAQVWEISVWRSTDASSWTKMTNASGETYAVGTTCTIAASGTGSIDVTLATPSRYVELRFYARAAQTPTEDGTYYGEFNTVQVYSETGNINLYEIANDIRGYLGLSVDTTWMASATMTTALLPFVTDGYEFYSTILDRAAGFGDASGNPVAVGIKPSRWTKDGQPAIFLEARPDPYTATTFDYQITTRTAQVPRFREDPDSVRNWVVVTYTDINDQTHTLDPNEQSTLTDATSTDIYGRRDLHVNAGATDAAGALTFGERILARYKDPLVSVSGPIIVIDALAHAQGVTVPASEIRAGKLLKVMDYPGLKGLVTATEYNDVDKTCAITLGAPDDLATYIANLSLNKGRLPF